MKNIIPLLLLPALALADPQPWMKKENREELYVEVFSTCPVPSEEASALVGEMIERSHLKMRQANPETQEGMPWLIIFLNCAANGEQCHADIDFVATDNDGYPFRYGFFGYGSRGNCSVSYDPLLDGLRGGIEAAISDYLKANFDLEEDE